MDMDDQYDNIFHSLFYQAILFSRNMWFQVLSQPRSLFNF